MGEKDSKVSSRGLSGPDCWVSRVEVSSVLQQEIQDTALQKYQFGT